MTIRATLPLLLLATMAVAQDRDAMVDRVLQDLASEDVAVREKATQTFLRIGGDKDKLISAALGRDLAPGVKSVLREFYPLPTIASLSCTEIAWKGAGPGETKGLHHSILVAVEADFGPTIAGLPEGRRPFRLAEVVDPGRVKVSFEEGLEVVAEGHPAKAPGPVEIGAEPVRFRQRLEGGGVDLVLSVSADQECSLLPWSQSHTKAAEVHLFKDPDAYVKFASDTSNGSGYTPPEVDFDRFRAVTIGWGPKPHTGCTADLRSVDVCAAATRIEVETTDSGCGGQAIRHPMVALAIPLVGPVEVHVVGTRYGPDRHFPDFADGEFDGVRVTVEPER